MKKQSAALKYFLALVIVGLAVLVRLALDPVLGRGTPFITLFLAVPLAAWLCGIGPGIVSLILAAVAAEYFLLAPRGSFVLQSSEDVLSLSVFVVMASGLLAVVHSLRKAWVSADERREELQTTLRSIGDGVITTDPQGCITSLNPVAEKLTGWEASEAVGKPLEEVFVIVSELTREPVENPVEKALRLGRTVGLANHTLLICKDGTERPIEDSAAIIHSPAEGILGIVLVFRDGTAKRHTERDLELRAKMLDSIGQAVIVTDSESNVIYWNQFAESLYGWSKEEAIGKNARDLVVSSTLHENAIKVHNEIWGGNAWSGEYVLQRKDGTQFPAVVSTSPVYGDNGIQVAAIGVSFSIEDRKANETILRRQAAIFEHQHDAIVMLNSENLITDLNPAAVKMLGYTKEELIGKPISIAHRAEEAEFILKSAEESIDAKGYWDAEVVFVRKDGSLGTCHSFAKPIYDDFSNFVGTISVNRDITEQKAAERELTESRKHLEDFFENATVGLHWVGADGTILRVNRAELELLGYTREEYVGRNVADFHLDKENIAEILRRLRNRENLVEHPATLVSKSGEAKQVLISSNVLWDENGNFVHTRCFTRDITKESAAREALSKSEERLRLALEAGKMGVWDWDIQNNTLDWTESLEPLHGMTPGEFDGTFESFMKVINEDDRPKVVESIQNAVKTKSDFSTEFRVTLPNGATRWIQGVGEVHLDSNGDPKRMVGIGADVSERKRTEEIAKFLAEASIVLSVLVNVDETLKKLASLAVPHFADWVAIDMLAEDESLRRVAVAHVDPNKVSLANELYERYGAAEDKSSGAWKVIQSGQPELVQEITEEMLMDAKIDQDLLQVIRELGLKSYIGVPIKQRGNAIGVMTFISAESDHLYDEVDLSVAVDLGNRASIALENAKLYQELTEADVRKDAFLATLAHELRNPLAPLTNSLELLKIAGSDPESVGYATVTMDRQLKQMVRLVDDLLDISRITRDKLELRREHMDVREAVEHAIDSVQRLLDLNEQELDVFMGPDVLAVHADPVRLVQIFGNLLTNASKYSPAGSRIAIKAYHKGSNAYVSVSDQGIGIPEGMLEEVFEMFTQVRGRAKGTEGGLGIGLALVKRLVEMHGGHVTAASEGEGKGSSFVVSLPLVSMK